MCPGWGGHKYQAVILYRSDIFHFTNLAPLLGMGIPSGHQGYISYRSDIFHFTNLAPLLGMGIRSGHQGYISTIFLSQCPYLSAKKIMKRQMRVIEGLIDESSKKRKCCMICAVAGV